MRKVSSSSGGRVTGNPTPRAAGLMGMAGMTGTGSGSNGGTLPNSTRLGSAGIGDAGGGSSGVYIYTGRLELDANGVPYNPVVKTE